MRVLGITGSHSRHLYFFDTLRRGFPLAGVILQEREAMIPAPPAGAAEPDRENWIRHFQGRADAERKYFGEPSLDGVATFRTPPETLNSEATIAFVRQVAPDVVVIFGCDLIKPPLADLLPATTLNLHLGLSPRYRGAATLFWPFYFLEPNYAGSTLHYIVAEPDAGDIVHQVTPQLERGDGIHDVGCKTVVASAVEVAQVLTRLRDAGRLERKAQAGTGKKFLESDFRVEHLRTIYDLCGNAVVRMYLDGEIRPREPKLFRQF